MKRLAEDELVQVMGIGYPGEIGQAPDGNLYQWVQGVDGLGNPYGSWRALRRIGRRLRPFLRRALPLIQKAASFVPVYGTAVAAGLRTATPFLRRAGVAGTDGLGALYQAPDGGVYEVAGYAQDEMPEGVGQEEEPIQVMGTGYLGDLAQAPDGSLCQWVQGVDGLGNPYGSWRKLRRLARRALKYHPVVAALRAARPLLRRALPVVQRVAPFVPGGEAVESALKKAAPILRQAGVSGYPGLGALYQAPDGSLYRVAGFEEDEPLDGYGEDEEPATVSQAEELEGYGEEEEPIGFAEDEELTGYGEDEEMGDLFGYVEEGVRGLDAFVPDQPSGTRNFTGRTPETWKSIW
jgi:hypothetical protein